MTPLLLPHISEADWVPIWPVVPLRTRVVDPETLMRFADAASMSWAGSEVMMREPSVTASVDLHMGSLVTVFDDWAMRGLVNEADASGLTVASVQGAAVAAASLNSVPARQRFSHPAFHIVLAFAEISLLEESSPAGVVALNAAYNGFTEDKALGRDAQ